MPKPSLRKEDAILENDMINTLVAGLKEWRSDLDFPQSYSDMQACVRGLMKMYEIKRRPLPQPLKIECHVCEGLGELVNKIEGTVKHISECPNCHYKGYVNG